jgi:hypothetical protein
MRRDERCGWSMDQVRALHSRGMAAVVGLHLAYAAEGTDHAPRPLSFRGVDAASYFRVAADPPGALVPNSTGDGCVFDFSSPPMRAALLDALRHWCALRACRHPLQHKPWGGTRQRTQQVTSKQQAVISPATTNPFGSSWTATVEPQDGSGVLGHVCTTSPERAPGLVCRSPPARSGSRDVAWAQGEPLPCGWAVPARRVGADAGPCGRAAAHPTVAGGARQRPRAERRRLIRRRCASSRGACAVLHSSPAGVSRSPKGSCHITMPCCACVRWRCAPPNWRCVKIRTCTDGPAATLGSAGGA